MKSMEKVISDRTERIESNNLKVVEYHSHSNIECICKKCGFRITDNHRNLSYRNFTCRYCDLLESSDIVRDGYVSVIGFDSKGINLRCKNGHIYFQLRGNLLAGKKCNQCYKEDKSFTLDEVLIEFKKVHGEYYSYNMENFKNLHSKIEITCSKKHNFKQKVSNHMQGKGCPVCRESFGERTISKFFDDNKIEYIKQKKFKDCKYVSHLPFDFFLPVHNILVEYDGIQHFKPIKQFGGEEEFKKTKIKDSIKTKYCLDKKINLIRISYQDNILEKLMCIKEDIILEC